MRTAGTQMAGTTSTLARLGDSVAVLLDGRRSSAAIGDMRCHLGILLRGTLLLLYVRGLGGLVTGTSCQKRGREVRACGSCAPRCIFFCILLITPNTASLVTTRRSAPVAETRVSEPGPWLSPKSVPCKSNQPTTKRPTATRVYIIHK